MAELVGAWAADGLPDPAGPAAAPYGLVPGPRIGSRRGWSAGFALPALTARVSTKAADGVQVMVAGKLFDTPQGATPADVIARSYRPERLDYAARLNGEFAAVIFDDRNARLILLRDRIGIRPLYFTRVRDGVMFSTLIKSLLTDPSVARRPNLRAVGEFFLGARWLHPGETLFDGISVLPPAHAAILSAQSMSIEQYWEPDPAQAAIRREYTEEFRHYFTQAVQRRAQARSAVFVSGGLDSSSILCVADHLSKSEPPLGLSFAASDGSPADEQRYLDALERHTGHRIERLPCDTAWVSGVTEQWVWHLELPYCDLPLVPHLRARALARERGATTILDGGWGDNVLAPWPPVYVWQLFTSLRWPTALRHLRAHLSVPSPEASGFLRKQFARMALRAATPQRLLDWRRPSINARIERAPFTPEVHAGLSRRELWDEWLPRGLSAHARSIFGTVRTPYFMAKIEAAGKMTGYYAAESGQPFLDLDLLTFLLRVPPTVLYRDGVYKALLRDSLRGLVPDEILARTDKGNYTEPANQTVLAGWDEMVSAVEACQPAYEHGVWERPAVKGVLEEIHNLRSIDLTHATGYLFDLYTLAVWLNVFFGRELGAGVENAKLETAGPG